MSFTLLVSQLTHGYDHRSLGMAGLHPDTMAVTGPRSTYCRELDGSARLPDPKICTADNSHSGMLIS